MWLNAGAIVLTYHSVNDMPTKYYMPVRTKNFKEQIKYLAQEYSILSFQQFIEWLADENRKTSERPCVITFDDGYADNYFNAFPILEQFSVPTTIFLTTGAIEGGKPLWFELLRYIFRSTLAKSFAFEKEYFNSSSEHKRAWACRRICQRLMKYNTIERDERIGQLADLLSVDLEQMKQKIHQDKIMLSWKQVRAMAQYSVAFGVHTVSHPILSALSSEEINEEISQSKQMIESQVNQSVRFFAYPNGTCRDFNDEVKQCLVANGFKAACTTIAGSNPKGTDEYEIKRMAVPDVPVYVFALWIEGLRIEKGFYWLWNRLKQSVN